MGWIHDRWHQVAGAGSGTWLAWAVWALLALGVIALVYTNVQIRRNRRLASEENRPHVGMFMEPHAADWHVMRADPFLVRLAFGLRRHRATPP